MRVATSGQLVSLDAVQGLRAAIADLFQVSDTTLDVPDPGYVRFRGQFLKDPASCFDDLRSRFEAYGFTPTTEMQGDRVALIGIPAVSAPLPLIILSILPCSSPQFFRRYMLALPMRLPEAARRC
jgi:hypothetical protein